MQYQYAMDLSGKSILIVEDEFLVASMLETMLGDLGCNDVTIAARLPDAMETVGKFRFDAVVLDINLDGKSSAKLAEHLSKNCIPFVFSTGYESSAIAERWRSSPFLQKPYTEKALKSALAHLLKS